MSLDADGLIKWGMGMGLAVFAWLYKGHENRLNSLEATRVLKADADEQRAALASDLKDFRIDTQRQLETLRVETNTKLEKLSDQLRALANDMARIKT